MNMEKLFQLLLKQATAQREALSHYEHGYELLADSASGNTKLGYMQLAKGCALQKEVATAIEQAMGQAIDSKIDGEAALKKIIRRGAI